MEKEPKDQRVTTMMSESELKAVDEWCHLYRIKSRGEGIRLLISVGLTMPDAVLEVSSLFVPHLGEDELNKAMERLDAEAAKFTFGLHEEEFSVGRGLHESKPKLTMPFDTAEMFDALAELMDNAVDASLPAINKGSPLTPREKRMVKMINNGLGVAEIAQLLGLSEKTITLFIRLIEKKIGPLPLKKQEGNGPTIDKKRALDL